ncbi:protein kinase [Streptomyces sp. NPDC047042]|uniref:serine/threonine-protein kinase n=1 Tax=Streptomyces sp. NPDC047042 TaxID=3154807 RepID=UPI00340B029A
MKGVLLAGRFRITERLGAGGMGEVWSAQDERMRRDVAVKLVHALPSGGDEAQTRARFEREVVLAARLSQQNIVTVHDWGEVEDGGRRVLYLVMELVRGVPLSTRLKKSTPPWPQAVGWAAQIAQALDAAHRKGVVHRDIKPANVLLTDAGTVKVLDFGVAKFMGDTLGARELTVTGTPLGSPMYMSPEQAEGVREIDHRSDLYSLGCLLYHAVAGRPPFTGTPLVVLNLQMRGEPVAPANLVEGLPGALDELVMCLLAKRPSERLQDADEVHKALSMLLFDHALTLPGDELLDVVGLGYGNSSAGRVLMKAWEATRAEADQILRRALREAEHMRQEAAQILAEAQEAIARAQGGATLGRCKPTLDLRNFGYDSVAVDQCVSELAAELDGALARVAELEKDIRQLYLASASRRIADTYAIIEQRGFNPVRLPRFQFRVVRPGYDRKQVDAFVSACLVDRDRALARITALKELRDGPPEVR